MAKKVTIMMATELCPYCHADRDGYMQVFREMYGIEPLEVRWCLIGGRFDST